MKKPVNLKEKKENELCIGERYRLLAKSKGSESREHKRGEPKGFVHSFLPEKEPTTWEKKKSGQIQKRKAKRKRVPLYLVKDQTFKE